MKLFAYFARRYPARSGAVLGCLLLAAAVEGLGLSSVLPVLQLSMGGGAGHAPTRLEALLDDLLASLDAAPTPELLIQLFVGAFLLKAVLVLLAKRQVGFAVAHVATDLRLDLLRALLSARWSHYTRLPLGGAANAIATEADRASLAFHHAAQVTSFAIQGLLYLTIAAAVSWPVTAAAVAAGGVSVAALTALVRMSGRAGSKQTRYLKSLLSRVTDTLQAAKVLKSMGREPLVVPLLEADTRQVNRALRRRIFSKEALRALQEPILVLFIAGGLYFGTVVYGRPMAELLLLGFLFARTLGSINLLQRRHQSLLTEASALWSLRDMIDRADADRERSDGTRAPTLERGITLRDVGVYYGDRAILDGLRLEMRAGELTALVGGSGSGKTTIADVITGLVRPDRGEVRVDGVPLDELDLSAWRRTIGYVPQEVLLLHGSLATNVSLGDPAVSDAAVEAALRDADAWDFVAQLPQGIHAPTGERGILLSGGQRQRVAIARALAHGATLLILDEATAGLDRESQSAVWKSLERLRGRVTVLAITHQPALASVADRVYRVESGRASLETPIAR
ncbi:MAG: ABC transporter ATP-binding protein [Myxococcota bacterium]